MMRYIIPTTLMILLAAVPLAAAEGDEGGSTTAYTCVAIDPDGAPIVTVDTGQCVAYTLYLVRWAKCNSIYCIKGVIDV